MAEKHSIEILSPAQYDLEQIVNLHISLSGSDYARKLSDEFFHGLEQLSMFPLSGSPLRDPELRALGYRFLPVRAYLIIYRVVDRTVFVYQITHGKTDYPTLFKTKFFS